MLGMPVSSTVRMHSESQIWKGATVSLHHKQLKLLRHTWFFLPSSVKSRHWGTEWPSPCASSYQSLHHDLVCHRDLWQLKTNRNEQFKKTPQASCIEMSDRMNLVNLLLSSKKVMTTVPESCSMSLFSTSPPPFLVREKWMSSLSSTLSSGSSFGRLETRILRGHTCVSI